MTVDVEEHFQVSAFSGVVPREDWCRLSSRVESNTRRVLDLLEECGVRATFFVLGWVGERYPALVRQIAERGHEIGAHGWAHRLVYEQRPQEFRDETMRARSVLQDASGQPVLGYRAASFSITRESMWGLDAMLDAGFAYDSSIYPVLHDRYGVPGAPRRPHRRETPSGRAIVEVPPSTITVGRLGVGVGGGGYLRIYPRQLTAWAIRRLNCRERCPAVVYIHPWELDLEQPRIRTSWSKRWRHYTGLRTTAPKLRYLAGRFRFGTTLEMLTEVGLLPRTSAAPVGAPGD